MMIGRQGLGVAVCALAALSAAAAPAAASVFLEVDVAELARMSSAVVHARVADLRSAWNDEHTFIFTWVTLRVEKSFRGAATETVVVRVPGGRVDDFVAEMEGAPQFDLDEEVVAFLGTWHDGVPMIAGYSRGVSRVEKDALGNRILRGGAAHGMPITALARAVGRAGR